MSKTHPGQPLFASVAQSTTLETLWWFQLLKLLFNFHHATTPLSICQSHKRKLPQSHPQNTCQPSLTRATTGVMQLCHGDTLRLAELLPSILLMHLCHLCANTREKQLLGIHNDKKSSTAKGEPSPQKRNTSACYLLYANIIFVLTFVVSQLPAEGAWSITAVTMVTWTLNGISTSLREDWWGVNTPRVRPDPNDLVISKRLYPQLQRELPVFSKHLTKPDDITCLT